MDDSTKGSLSDAYLEACCDEPDRVFDFRREKKVLKYHVVVHETHTNKPLVWAIPNLMTREECDCVLEQIKEHGLYGKHISQRLLVKDMFDYDGNSMEPLSEALLPRVQYDYNLHKSLRSHTENVNDQVHSISSTWRVLKLKEDEEFPAHRDGMDSVHLDGDCAVSTHSVLLDFHRGYSSGATGGAIRFYYRRYPCDGPYDYLVDVHLPPGWALVMEQRPDLWYALQPMDPSKEQQQQLEEPCRYVAQAGMLQILSPGETVESLRRSGRGTFALGPGLHEFFEDEVEKILGDAAPLGWGEHAINPKSTLWKAGRPILPDLTRLVQARRHSTSGLLQERRWSMVNERSNDHSSQSTIALRKKSNRRQSLQARIDPIRGQVSFVEGRRPTIPTTVQTRRKTMPSTHQQQERGSSSFVDLMMVNQSTIGRERAQRRHSLQMQVDPSRRHVSYVLPQPTGHKKAHPHNGDDSVTSITADLSESFRSIEDEIVSVPRRRHSIQVTRQPRRDSLVGKLMTTFQTGATASTDGSTGF